MQQFSALLLCFVLFVFALAELETITDTKCRYCTFKHCARVPNVFELAIECVQCFTLAIATEIAAFLKRVRSLIVMSIFHLVFGICIGVFLWKVEKIVLIHSLLLNFTKLKVFQTIVFCIDMQFF
jgi:hypothetical protein